MWGAKNVVKIGAFPNATPASKIWKNLSVDQKDQRRRSVWVGHAGFSKIAQRKQKFIKHVNCLFTQENWCTVEAHEHFIIVYKSVLSVFTQEFSLVVWLHVRPENEPKKFGQCRYFWVFRTDPKKIRSSATPAPPPPPHLEKGSSNKPNFNLLMQ